jgi:hypothetical protein
MNRAVSICGIVILCAAAGILFGNGRAGVFQDFVVEPEEIAGLYGVIKAVHFKEARLRGWHERNGDAFLFKSENPPRDVRFRSAKLAALCGMINNAQQFNDFVGRATVYGVDLPGGGLEGRLFLGTVCHDKNCADEDYVCIRAD